jgi:hypothetical protein
VSGIIDGNYQSMEKAQIALEKSRRLSKSKPNSNSRSPEKSGPRIL